MITVEHQTVAQALIDDLVKERDLKKTESQQLEGAIQGVNLLFARLVEMEQSRAAAEVKTAAEVEVIDEQDSQSEPASKLKKAK